MNRLESIKERLELGNKYDTKYSIPNDQVEYLLQRLERSEKALNRLYLTCPIPALSPFDEESHRTEYVDAIAETAEVLTENLHGKYDEAI